ncbi:MAG: acyl-CoA dehydrogenase family protein, partial [Cognatishimia activa]
MMIPRDLYEEEHEIFRNSVVKWCEEHIAPNAEQWLADGQVSKEVWKAAGEAGFLAMYADEAYGGLGVDDFRYDQILMEEITKYSSGLFLPLHNRIVGPYFQKFGTKEQKDRLMPGIVSGDKILAIAITEPGTGSDMAGIRSRAEDKGDHWVLNGSKTYISNGLISDVVLVAARTHPDNPHAMGLFIVEAGMEGFQRGRKLKKLGLHAQD